ncbi:carboxypeptidase-like regulatory domain-containing protein [Hymenobacter sp. BT635]|uniref:Carboxypeptidase-like regulatory domain-containing protein n=1 Tax=Hymenobacter nitidus TaxID=2880929 RepID=A0ABS8AJ85_9BACT|nr:carboxypeptidase-like regulatory domain-containing protein [Hymenobacter nitidus]MCB2380062.1 carboxypeptidase-like regulatory domain-containing protein [Hymenobacter nitidus]
MPHLSTYLAGFAFVLAPGAALAQQPVSTPDQPLPCQSLSGIVTDEKQQPLTGATVVVQGIQDAYSTNSEGQYIVTSKKTIPLNAQLQISAAGYETQKLVLSGCQPPAVTLKLLPGTRFKRDGRIKKTTSTGKIKY